jgi:outer membrane protein OmpA-like peptidoglycan-associated protein
VFLNANFMMKKSTILAIALLAGSATANAQRYFGVSTGNYLPTKTVFLNPALIADSKLKWSIDLFSLNATLDQNYGTINTEGGLFKKLTESGEFDLNTIDKLLTKGDRERFDLLGGLDVSIFNIYASFKNKHHFALTNRVRTMAAIRNYDASFFNNLFNVNGGVTSINVRDMRVNVNVWSELGLTYASTLWQNEKSALSFGATLKYLGGLSYMGTNITELNGTYSPDPADPDQTILTANSIRLNGSTSADLNNNGSVADNIFQRATSIFDGNSSGFGADFGLTYEILQKPSSIRYEMNGRKDNINPEKNRYKVRFSAAITDLGTINYKNTTNLTANGGGVLSTDSLGDKFGNLDELRAYLASRGVQTDYHSGTGTQKINLPGSLVFGVDYNINNAFYANATYIHGFVPSTTSLSPFASSQLTITPRYEKNIVTVAVPLTYNFFTESMKAGLGLRLSGLYLGTDDAYALLANNKAKGVNFYLGAQIPFAKKKMKDTDGDKVSNKYDKCNGVAGLWEDLGCPPKDRDKDGIVDSLDKCPDIAGVSTAQGCPDADLDGIADGEDLCPNEAGSAATNGCPDRDGDGVADKDDKCPDVAGTAQFQGCNDTDGDGIADWEDQCPEKAGPKANNGCPDTDNDGIPDHQDKCPTVPGTAANQGCPEVRAEVKKRLAFAATAIQFETGKALIKKTSYKMLDEIVAILNEYNDYDMTIDGHTDNTGKADRNMELSQQRADAVKQYFIDKGIAASRLTATGYGQDQPVADNKTAAGRAKNRRVDMDLKLR